MAILEHEVRLATSGLTGLRRYLFTQNEYHAMANAGVFGDTRIELIEGEVIEMAPIGDAHAAVTHPLAMLLETAFGPGYAARNQAPISLIDNRKPSEPQPDIAVVIGSWRDYVARTPVATDIKLIVEIADSTLATDRKVKSVLYASSNIPEYWIVNLAEKKLEVYRDPAAGLYTTVQYYKTGSTVTPLFVSNLTIDVSDFMP